MAVLDCQGLAPERPGRVCLGRLERLTDLQRHLLRLAQGIHKALHGREDLLAHLRVEGRRAAPLPAAVLQPLNATSHAAIPVMGFVVTTLVVLAA